MAGRKATSIAASRRRTTMKIRTGDQVKVISGKDRGKTGRILRVQTDTQRVFVEGLNMIKRHTRPSQVAGAQSEQQVGGVIEREGPIHVSNVMLLDAKGAPTRVRIEREDGRRFRVAKTTGARLD
jgi:large subunit ribosomal protein L24